MTVSFRGNKYTSAHLVRSWRSMNTGISSELVDVVTGERLTREDVQFADLILRIEDDRLNVVKDRRGSHGSISFAPTGDDLADVAKILLLF